MKTALLAVCFMLVSCLGYSPTLKMEAKVSPETSVDFQRTIWRYIPEYRTLHYNGCENLKSYKKTVISVLDHQTMEIVLEWITYS
jgi:hypothetical protein